MDNPNRKQIINIGNQIIPFPDSSPAIIHKRNGDITIKATISKIPNIAAIVLPNLPISPP